MKNDKMFCYSQRMMDYGRYGLLYVPTYEGNMIIPYKHTHDQLSPINLKPLAVTIYITFVSTWFLAI